MALLGVDLGQRDDSERDGRHGGGGGSFGVVPVYHVDLEQRLRLKWPKNATWNSRKRVLQVKWPRMGSLGLGKSRAKLALQYSMWVPVGVISSEPDSSSLWNVGEGK